MLFDQLRRREFITLLGGAAAAWPLAARAQQAIPLIGYLGTGSPESDAFRVTAFQQGLGEAGFMHGRNVAIEYRWAQDQYDRLPAIAAELVRRQVAVLVASPTPAALAAKTATATIPIIFFTGGDPVTLGLVTSLNQPGGNATGVTNLSIDVGRKLLELLHEAVPTASAIALLVNPSNPGISENQLRDAQEAARTLGLQLHVLNASAERDFDVVFATLVQLRAALVIGIDALFSAQSKQLAALALRHRVPSIYNFSEFARAGGLMSYGGNFTDAYRQVGVYTGRILKGEKPADLPVVQSTKVELIINMKTAEALGLTFPLTLLGRADEVIE
jgi:putative tryptophan/tyrosine transport system substrate-binding protein